MTPARRQPLPTRSKVRVLSIAIAALLLWPFVHYVLVRNYDLNPWKLAGWAMYSRLGPEATVSAFGVNGQERQALDLDAAQPEVREAARRYQWRTRQYGLLVRPNELAQLLLEAFPAFESVVIQRDSPFLDSQTDRLAVRRTVFQQARNSPLQRVDERTQTAP